METDQYPDEPQSQPQQQQEQSIMEIEEEPGSFIPSRDAAAKSRSSMDSLRVTTPMSREQPQESTFGVQTTPKKRGRPKKRLSLALPMQDEPSQDSTAGMVVAPAKKRGRPKKRLIDEMAQMMTAGEDETDADYNPTPKELKARTRTLARPKRRETYEMANPTEARAEYEDEAAAQKEEQGPELYVRPVARYVAPPAQDKPPGLRSIYFAFQAEKDVGEEDPFSAYAFGAPRHRKPFRRLQNIGDPNEKDISGWAENLRWAREQWKFFLDATGWNESPEQMEMIASIREEQTWLSDELVAHLEKPKKKSKKKVRNEEMQD